MNLGQIHEPRDCHGASAVEYALLIAGIAALAVAAVFLFGGGVKGLFDDSCDTIYSTSCSNE